MDPVSAIVTALVTGAAAALKPTTEKAIKDIYEGIKALIKRKMNTPVIEVLEADPTSEAAKNLLHEQLIKASAGDDEELLTDARQLLKLIKQHVSDTPDIIGVRLDDIEAASLTLDDIVSSGSGVMINKSKIRNDIKISGVRAGNKETDSNPG